MCVERVNIKLREIMAFCPFLFNHFPPSCICVWWSIRQTPASADRHQRGSRTVYRYFGVKLLFPSLFLKLRFSGPLPFACCKLSFAFNLLLALPFLFSSLSFFFPPRPWMYSQNTGGFDVFGWRRGGQWRNAQSLPSLSCLPAFSSATAEFIGSLIYA